MIAVWKQLLLVTVCNSHASNCHCRLLQNYTEFTFKNWIDFYTSIGSSCTYKESSLISSFLTVVGFIHLCLCFFFFIILFLETHLAHFAFFLVNCLLYLKLAWGYTLAWDGKEGYSWFGSLNTIQGLLSLWEGPSIRG